MVNVWWNHLWIGTLRLFIGNTLLAIIHQKLTVTGIIAFLVHLCDLSAINLIFIPFELVLLRTFLIILCFSSIGVNSAYSQSESTAIDSLKTLIAENDDRNAHLHLLKELGIAYVQVNLDSCHHYTQLLLEQKDVKADPEVHTQATNTLGLYFDATGQFDSAFHYYEKGLALAQASNLPVLEVVIANNMGLAYMKTGANEQAKNSFEKGYLLASELLEKGVEEQFVITLERGLAGNRYNLGMIFYYSGDYALALEYLQESLQIYKKVNDKQGQMLVNRQTGLLLSRMGNYEQASSMYEASLLLAEELSNHTVQILLHLSLSTVHRNLADYAACSDHLDQAFALLSEHPNPGLMITLYTQQGQLYIAEAKYEEALVALDSAQALALRSDKQSKIPKLYLHYAEAYLSLERYPEARTNLAAGVPIYAGYSNKDRYAKALKLWIVYHTALEQPDSALQYANQYIAVKDSLVPQSTMNQIAVMYARFWSEEQEHTLALAQKNEEIQAQEARAERLKREQAETQNYYLIGGAILLLLLSYVTYRWYTLRRKAEMQARLTEQELKALRAQMNPHFLFNVLNGAQGMINNNDLRSANLFLSRCAKLTRAYLEQSDTPVITLEVELNTIQLYLDLESLRFDFEYDINVDPVIETDVIHVPSMLIQPFVENAILHGIAKKKAGGRVLVEVKAAENGITCMVEDNGVGRKASAEKPKSHESMGMKITESRFRKIQAAENEAIVPKIIDLTDADGNPAGTRVELFIPAEVLSDQAL